jgi:putative ATP-binding cassette transporter
MGLAFVWMAMAVYRPYLSSMLQIRWRRWLTEHYLDAWLDRQTYYRMQLADTGTDNPDQRISDDLRLFCVQTLALGLGLLSATVTLFSFLFILWTVSGDIPIPLGTLGTFEVPHFLVWVAVVYATLGTWLTVKVGRPLVRLNFFQQRYEADFRFSMVRLRENAESVAFYGGEGRENQTFRERFSRVYDNFWLIMRRQKRLSWLTSTYGQAIVLLPYVATAPRYFAERMPFGELSQIAQAFDQVQSALSFIITSYTDPSSYTGIAEWQAVVQRLSGFQEKIAHVAAANDGPQPIVVERSGEGLEVEDLTLALPDGRVLGDHVSLAAAPGSALLVSGPSGSGKSTLLRAIAGIWPFGKGKVRRSAGRALFLPQRPYIPLGTLRDALLYPDSASDLPAEQLAGVLEQVGLAHLASHLDEAENWAQSLSIGEQQRLAFARVLLTQPEIVFLDEATSALDEPSEQHLYRVLRDAPWHPTIVSVGHRSTIREFHDSIFNIAAGTRPLAAR